MKYAHLQVMGTITGKFHQNPLKTVGDRQTDEPITIVPLDKPGGTMRAMTVLLSKSFICILIEL